jgi:hypothetical protein
MLFKLPELGSPLFVVVVPLEGGVGRIGDVLIWILL